jgi:hypothetical protein
MSIAVDLIVGAAAIYIGRIEKHMNVATVSIPLAVPLGCLSAVGAGIAVLLLFKTGVFILFLLFLLITKFKIFIGAKIAAVFASFAATALGLLLGPPGWIILSIAFLVVAFALLGAIVDSFQEIYNWFFRKFAELLLWVRRICDSARESLYEPARPAVLLFEVPVVCGSAVYSVWKIMDWLGGAITLGQPGALFRCICLVPLTVLTYKAYIHDTTPPNDGGEGLDVPLPSLLPP